MKSLYQLSVLYVLFGVVICQQRYQWTCTAPDENGQWYIPSVRTRDPILTSTTPDNELHIYRVPTLDASCYGTVTAIEYCYRYTISTAGSGQVTFNYTVLILEDIGNNFLINRTYTIQSHGSVGSPHCNRSGDQVICCDVTNIDNFILSSNFIFGVIQSAQGNTNGVTLLGFHHTEYVVDVELLNGVGLILSVGSTIRNGFTVLRGIRMLWFVIGIVPTESTTTTISISSSIATTEPPLPTNATISSITTTSGSTTAIDTQTTIDQKLDAPASTLQDISVTQEERDSTAAAMAPILTLVGAVVGAVILLSVITVLILLMACLVRKNKILKRDLNSGNGREIKTSEAEKTDAVDIEVDTNPSYIPLCTQILTENNVAYGEVMMNQDGNDLYEIMDPPIEDSTTRFAQDGRSGEYTTEYYDYVN